MDCTELRETMKSIAGKDVSFLETTDTLYFDETCNIKKFRLTESGFNVDADSHFVLGGIEAKDTITLEELIDRLNLNRNINELKSKHIYKGEFEDILKEERLFSFLSIIDEREWHVHFSILNVLYFTFADIVDSLNIRLFGNYIFDIKTLLYKYMKNDMSSTISFLLKYDYPNVKDEDIPAFCKEIKKGFCDYLDKSKNYAIKLLGSLFIMALSMAEKEGKMVFIQNGKSLELINELSSFYINRVYFYSKAKLVFDEESDVKNCMERHKIFLEGKEITNYSMVDSKNNPMIQISDVVVGIISRYMKFLDNNLYVVLQKYERFNNQQQKCFVLLNKILNKSLEYNPTFWYFNVSQEQYQNMTILMNKSLGIV